MQHTPAGCAFLHRPQSAQVLGFRIWGLGFRVSGFMVSIAAVIVSLTVTSGAIRLVVAGTR